MSELPLFPLSSVLLPFGRMPLQIFEQRYLDLVRDSMKSDSPFGVVWIRRGAEVAQRGRASPELGDYGTCARIVDWDQLPNGLLGITIEGAERFDLHATSTRANGLVVGEVELRSARAAGAGPVAAAGGCAAQPGNPPPCAAHEPAGGLRRRLAGGLHPGAVAAPG